MNKSTQITIKQAFIEYDDLTDRQATIAEMVCLGFNNDEIAQKMDLHVITVKSHLTNTFKKLNLKNRNQLLSHFIATFYGVDLIADSSLYNSPSL